jgi:alcohol dehydrogenase
MAHGDVSNIALRTDYPDPSPAPDEVVVKVAATGVNYHDVFTRRGMPGIKSPLPVIVGSDIAGEIASLGSEVTGWQPGARVLIDPVFRDGKRFGMVGETVDGGRAEYVAVAASQLLPVPEGLRLEVAASLPLAYGSAYRMLFVRGALAAGERVLILGASGGVGVACVQLAKLAGAEVIACVGSAQKADRLRKLGADHCVDYNSADLTAAVHGIVGKPRISGQGGVDVAVNFTGGDTWIPTQKCIRNGGRILTIGATAGFDVRMDLRYLWTFEQQMIGSNGWLRDDLLQLMALIADGRLTPEIDRILPLEQSADAERLLEERRVLGKIVLKP